MAFPFKGGRLIQVKITKKDKHGTATGWPRSLNRGGRLIQVRNTAFVSAKNRDFKDWPLNRGWPLNTGPLNTGSTVIYDNFKPHRETASNFFFHYSGFVSHLTVTQNIRTQNKSSITLTEKVNLQSFTYASL